MRMNCIYSVIINNFSMENITKIEKKNVVKTFYVFY